jgi:hypothetical protein
MRAAIQRQRFFEAILPIEDVGKVRIEAREPQPIAGTLEDRPCLPRPRLGCRIPTEIDEGLKAAAASDGFFERLARFAKARERGLIGDDRRLGTPFEQEDVSHGSQRSAGRVIAADRRSEPFGGLGEALRLRQVDAAA